MEIQDERAFAKTGAWTIEGKKSYTEQARDYAAMRNRENG